MEKIHGGEVSRMKVREDYVRKDDAPRWVTFCLDQLEKTETFSKGIGYDTVICNNLSLEEVIGALVAAELYIKGVEEFDRIEDIEE